MASCGEHNFRIKLSLEWLRVLLRVTEGKRGEALCHLRFVLGKERLVIEHLEVN